MAPSVPVIARPQLIRCLCDFPSYDGFTISCDKCARWCHAACFDIQTRADVPEHWLCWVCSPRPGINKTKAVVLQASRQAGIEKDLRDQQLAELARVPALERLTRIGKDPLVMAVYDTTSTPQLVTDNFSKLEKIQVSEASALQHVHGCPFDLYRRMSASIWRPSV
jgi:hypothetical protein